MARRLLAILATTAGLVAATLGHGGTAHAARDRVSYYRVSRPSFYLHIEVRHHVIVKTEVKANYSCVGGSYTVLGFGLNFEGRDLDIPLTRGGHFKYENKNNYERTVFRGRVTARRATGFFRYVDHSVSEPECGSGSRKRRTERFSAGRSSGFPPGPLP